MDFLALIIGPSPGRVSTSDAADLGSSTGVAGAIGVVEMGGIGGIDGKPVDGGGPAGGGAATAGLRGSGVAEVFGVNVPEPLTASDL